MVKLPRLINAVKSVLEDGRIGTHSSEGIFEESVRVRHGLLVDLHEALIDLEEELRNRGRQDQVRFVTNKLPSGRGQVR